MADLLHTALKTEVLESRSSRAGEVQLVRLQHGRDAFTYGIHVRPTTFSLSGWQSTDLLGQLGFQQSQCQFALGGQCFAAQVREGFDAAAFADALDQGLGQIEAAMKHLEACWLRTEQPEGWRFFFGGGRRSGGRRTNHLQYTDGHSAAEAKRLKEAEDDHFRFVFTYLKAERATGWVIHYAPKHPPLSAEVRSVFKLVGLKEFRTCPEFDFEPCYWSGIDRQEEHMLFANYAHDAFDKHPQHFSAGVEGLLNVQAVFVPFGFSFLPVSETPERTEIRRTTRTPDLSTRPVPATQSVATSTPYAFRVAISFAGAQRPLAEALARAVRSAGFNVFYDDFYEEQLWGKDLPVFFDDIYRKASEFCVIFVSKEYADGMWTQHERRSAVARMVSNRGTEYILPIKVDDTELAGVAPTTGYLSIDKYSIERIAEILVQKLGNSRRD